MHFESLMQPEGHRNIRFFSLTDESYYLIISFIRFIRRLRRHNQEPRRPGRQPQRQQTAESTAEKLRTASRTKDRAHSSAGLPLSCAELPL